MAEVNPFPIPGHPQDLEYIAPGLRGFVIPGDPIVIHLLQADVPGKGAGGAYLDSLPKNRTIVVTRVISRILAGMLSRRGFRQMNKFDDWIREGAQ